MSVTNRPLPKSFRPSIVFTWVAVFTSKISMLPTSVATATWIKTLNIKTFDRDCICNPFTSSPLGENATHVTSERASIVSCSLLLSRQFQIFTVLSQEPEMSVEEVATGEKATDVTGPSWPLMTSNSLPVLMDHRNISKTSWPPATTNSPEKSIATQANWAGLGDVNVLKFRYLYKWKLKLH